MVHANAKPRENLSRGIEPKTSVTRENVLRLFVLFGKIQILSGCDDTPSAAEAAAVAAACKLL